MVTTITTSTEFLSRANVVAVLGIDLVVILILIGLLILKEFLKSYFEQYDLLQQETKVNIGQIVDIAIVPFLYVFSYVLIYRATHIM